MAEPLPIYDQIDRPYDNFLSRDTIGSSTSIETQTDSGGLIKSGGSLTDSWLETWLKSRNYKPKTQGFLIDARLGYIECMKLFVGSGGIIGGSLDIPDLVTANSFHVNGTGNMWLGATTFAAAPFSVANTGVLTAISGTIGGCALGSTSIGSTTFVSGPLGSGWNISNTGTAEFQNATVRGVIRTSVFEKDTISAVNGMVMISKADVLSIDMTALDASTLTISGESSFVANEVIRIKDGTDDEWLLVTSAVGAPTYVVTRDLAGSYAANTNPIWKKGTAVVSMGVGTGTKTGFILFDSSSANSPYIDVYGRNSNTYTDYTLHGRFGWLKGITDADVGLATTDTWGLYTDNAYIKGTVVATAGKFGTTTNYWSVGATGLTATSSSTDVIINYGKTDFAQDSTAGFILGYDYSSTKAKFEIGSSATKILKYDGTDFSLIGGTITSGTVQTAASGARIELVSSTTRLNAINSSGTVASLNYGETANVGILRLTPAGIAARALEIIIPTLLGSDARGITIDNGSLSDAITIYNSGLNGIFIQNCLQGAIDINHSGAAPAISISGSQTAAGINIEAGGDYACLKMIQSGTATNSYGIHLYNGTEAIKSGIYVQSIADSNLSQGIYIKRDGNSSSDAHAMRIDISNGGAGLSAGIDFRNIGANQGIVAVNANATDPTGGGGAATGRIPIVVGGAIKYLAYY